MAMYRLFSLVFCLFFFSLSNAQQANGDLLQANRSKFLNCAILSPQVSQDGNSIYFVVEGHKQNIGFEDLADVWKLTQKGRTWKHAINIGAPVNDRTANQVVGLDENSQLLYLKNETGDLLVASKKGRFWSIPETMTIDSMEKLGLVTDYALSLDGSILFIAATSDSNTTDLLIAFRKDYMHWSQPIPLTHLNTAGNETGMCLALDGKTLYFASDGLGGEGGYDLFMSKRLDDSWLKWSPAQNLGSAINTPADEWSCTIAAQGKDLIFATRISEQTSQLLKRPLPETNRPEPVLVVNGTIIEAHSEQSVPASLELQNLKNVNKRLTITSDQNGQFSYVVPYGESVGIHAQAKGYFSQSSHMALSNEQVEELDFDPSKATASLEFSTDYMQREADIQNLNNRLSELQEKLASFNKKRVAYQQAALEERRRQAAEYGATFYQTDSELDALRNRYENFLQSTSVAEQEAMNYEQETNDLFLRDTIIPRGNNNTKPASNDRELNDMRSRYNDYYLKKKGYLPEEKEEKDEEENLLWDDGLTSETKWSKKKAPEVPNVAALQLPESYVTKGGRIDTTGTQSFKSYLATGLNKKEVKEQGDWQQQFAVEKTSITSNSKEELYRQKIESEEKRLKTQLEEKVRQQILEEQQAGYQAATYQAAPNKIIPNTTDTPQAYQEIKQEIVLIPIEEGKSILLENIFFQPNTATLKASSFQELERVLLFLKNHPKVEIELAVHTNGELSHTFAMQLSNKRANVLRTYLIKQGIAEAQMIAQGYGKTMPITSNDTLEGRKRNQRVEMKIIAIYD